MIDYLIVGSGFGGSVAALRLVERGCRVTVLEQGRRFAPADFAATNWDLRRWLWQPRLGLRGPFRMSFLRHVTALTGVGVGGGSLVYANTLEQPGHDFLASPNWAALADWQAELAPHYDTARRMLGAVPYPRLTWGDELLAQLARDRGQQAGFAPTSTAVFYGEPGQTMPDPYFGGEGPDRTGCTHCGGCMLGCRHGAKNTLDRNYLYLAERRGLDIREQMEVVWIRPSPGGYEVSALAGPASFGRRRRLRRFQARHVVLAAGVLGTTRLLLRLRASPDGLPALAPALGRQLRTNSEVLLGVITQRRDRSFAEGVAITSILRLPDGSSVEPVRYPEGSGFFRLMIMPHGAGATAFRRLGSALGRVLRQPLASARALLVPDLARSSLILLYMRAAEGTLALDLGLAGRLRTRVTAGPAPTAALPEATAIAEDIAGRVGGYPVSLFTEVLFGTPTTAHILGGCVIGESPASGVVDAQHRVFGYPGLFVVDGSVVPANPGVNPALTITALAERAVPSWEQN